MLDDFAALDPFTAAGKKKAGRKLIGLPRRKVNKSARNDEKLAAAFKPLITKIKKKQKADAVDAASLQGWPVSLSWTAPRDKQREDFSAYF